VYVDPSTGGHPIDLERLLALAHETLGDERAAAERLEPVGARTVAVRLLLNLHRTYRGRADHARALVVCDRLVDLTGAPFHRADRGAHALALGATRAALADFAAYLAAHPGAADADQVRTLLSKARSKLVRPAN
jgi:regulator of sirC expression with transglutaminase-like and TPR domain